MIVSETDDISERKSVLKKIFTPTFGPNYKRETLAGVQKEYEIYQKNFYKIQDNISLEEQNEIYAVRLRRLNQERLARMYCYDIIELAITKSSQPTCLRNNGSWRVEIQLTFSYDLLRSNQNLDSVFVNFNAEFND